MRMGDSVTSVTSVEILTPSPHERRSPRILLEWREIEWAAGDNHNDQRLAIARLRNRLVER